MAAKFIITAGPEAGREFTLEPGQTVQIGRGQAAQWQLSDPHVSRVHCQLAFEGGRVVLSDNASTGGTLLAGQKVTRSDVLPGASFQLGDTVFCRSDRPVEQDATIRRPPTGPVTRLLGTTISRYELQSIIHESPASVVFKAHDTVKNRDVALKVLAPDSSRSEEQQERFVRAMKSMDQVRHPNLVRIYYAGKQGPYLWASMEYVAGESLNKVIEKFGIGGQLDWSQAYRCAVDISQALNEAHRQKVIHRNVTPGNILRRSADKRFLLADLMLAKALEGDLAKQVTQPGQLVGSLPYMSPERTRDDQAVDHRSDLYGLGATLYALITGRPPCGPGTIPEMLRNIRETKPRAPKEFQLSVNARFQGLVLQLLEKRPEDRYQSPEEVLGELESIGKFAGLSPT